MTISLSLDLLTSVFLVSQPSVSAEILVPAASAQIDPYVGTTISGTCSAAATSVEVFLDSVGGTSLGTAAAAGGTWSMSNKLTDFAQAGAHTLIAVANGGVASAPTSITILSVKQSLALIPGLVRAYWVPLTANVDYRVDAGNAEGGTRIDRWWSSTDPVNHVASQDTDADQPELVTVSGCPMLRFSTSGDANGDRLSFANAFLSGLANFDLFIAYKRDATGANEDLLSCDSQELAIRLSSSARFQVFLNGSSNLGFTAINAGGDANPHVARVRWDGAGATNADRLKIEIDGVDQTVSFTGTPAQTAGHTAMCLGRLTGDTTPFTGAFALLWAFNTNLTAPQLAKVEALIDYLVPWATFS